MSSNRNYFLRLRVSTESSSTLNRRLRLGSIHALLYKYIKTIYIGLVQVPKLSMKLSFENLVESKLAVIPLYPIEPWNDKKEIPEDKRGARAARDAFKEVKLELRANPAAADSLKYGSYFKVFDQGTPEQWCRWRDDLKRAWAGLGNTTGPLRAATVRHLLEGQALDDFENYMRPDDVTVTVDNINKALKMVAVNIFPADAVTHMCIECT